MTIRCLTISLALLSSLQHATADRAGSATGGQNLPDRQCIAGTDAVFRLLRKSLLHNQFPEHNLVIRNLGFSGDEVRFRPRSLDFGTPDQHLSMQKADVILAFFGFNESFNGPEGLNTFEQEVNAVCDSYSAAAIQWADGTSSGSGVTDRSRSQQTTITCLTARRQIQISRCTAMYCGQLHRSTRRAVC